MYNQVAAVGGLKPCYPGEGSGACSSFLSQVTDKLSLVVKAVDSAGQHTAVLAAPQGLLVRQDICHKKGLVISHCYLGRLPVWERYCCLV